MKKSKAIISIGVIILLSILNYVWADKRKIDTEDALLKAFQATEAEVLEVNINASGKIMDKFINTEELKEVSKGIAKEIGIVGSLANANKRFETSEAQEQEQYNIETIESEDMVQLILWGKDKYDRAATIILSSYIDTYENIEETDLVIDIVQNNSLTGLKDYCSKMKNIFNSFNCQTKISTCIIGTYDGKLKENEKLNIISKALKSIDGRKVEGLIDSRVISISAYSPEIEQYILTADKKMNINIALRYNEYENKTYLWIGTPIISVGY